MPDSDSLPMWLRRQLDRRDWSQADFARRLNVGTGLVSRWMTGKRTPSPRYCDLIADVLGVDLDVVLLMANHRAVTTDLDPDDPRIELEGLVHRVQWNKWRVKQIAGQLRVMVEEDREKVQ